MKMLLIYILISTLFCVMSDPNKGPCATLEKQEPNKGPCATLEKTTKTATTKKDSQKDHTNGPTTLEKTTKTATTKKDSPKDHTNGPKETIVIVGICVTLLLFGVVVMTILMFYKWINKTPSFNSPPNIAQMENIYKISHTASDYEIKDPKPYSDSGDTPLYSIVQLPSIFSESVAAVQEISSMAPPPGDSLEGQLSPGPLMDVHNTPRKDEPGSK